MNKITFPFTPKSPSKNEVGNLFINPRSPEDVYVLVLNPTDGGYFATNIRSGGHWTCSRDNMTSAVSGLEKMESGTKFTVEVE